MTLSKKSQLVKTDNNFVLQENEKISLVQQKVEKLDIVFQSSDITNIAANVKNEFVSKRSLNAQIFWAIKKYFEHQNTLQLEDIENLKNSIIEFENTSNAKTVESLKSLANSLNNTNVEWRQAVNEILEIFSP